MNYTKLYPIILAVAITISGCFFNEQTFPEQEALPETSEPVVTELSEPTSAPTEPPTEPDLSLDIEPGSYLLRFFDVHTEDYLDYYLFIPENAEINMPLVVFLHGDGEVGKPEALENYSMIAQARMIYGEKFPFLGLSPCTRTRSWVDGTIPETLKGLIDSTVSEYSTDPNRIIITGHSRGAIGVWNMVDCYGSYFSCAVPISCGCEKSLDYEKFLQIPIWAFAGNSGEFEIKYNNAMQRICTKIREAGGSAVMTTLDGATHQDTLLQAYTQEVFEWMLMEHKE